MVLSPPPGTSPPSVRGTPGARTTVRAATVLLVAVCALGPPSATGAAGAMDPARGPTQLTPSAGAVWPLAGEPRVTRRFTPPPTPYGRGHRGVDLAGPAGTQVSAARAGTVSFAAVLAGRGVVVVAHPDGLRT